jgi:hypothetical protein
MIIILILVAILLSVRYFSIRLCCSRSRNYNSHIPSNSVIQLLNRGHFSLIAGKPASIAR